MKRRIISSLVILFLCSPAVLPLFAADTIVISEFMANNNGILADEDGDFSDWIELHNPTATVVELEGYYLSDDPGLLTKWAFPAVSLSPDGYLVVFASGKNRSNPGGQLHTSFQLNTDGEFLALVLPDGHTLASVFNPEYPPQREDVAYGVAQQPVSIALIASSVPQILVPANAGELPANWSAVDFQPDGNWINGSAPAAIGFDTDQPTATPVNVAPGGTAVQSTTSGGNTANLATDGSTANFTHTLSADTSPFWQVTLASETAVYRVVLRNRTSCCQSRLRDITVQILSADGNATNYNSSLLNAENVGYTYPAGPASIEVDLTALAGGPVLGQVIRVLRAPDPDLSGSGGQGGADEVAVLSLAEVEVHGVPTATEVNLARTGSPAPTASQSSTLSTYTPDLAINGNLGDFTHTASADSNPTWTLNLGRRSVVNSVTIHNRDDCCGSRLRDLTVQILDTDGSTAVYTSPLLNPENAGYSFPNGPDHLDVVPPAPVLGQYVRIRRTPDPDLSGTGGQGNTDEAGVLALGEVIVLGLDVNGYRPFIRTDLENQMLGNNASAFVRLPFTVDDPSVLDELTLRLRYDDGFIAYLNGVKIAERNAPATPAWNSAATVDRDLASGILPETISLTDYLPQLMAGVNVLAIQAMNSSVSDGNFLLQPELTGAQIEESPYAYLVDATPGTRNETDYYFGDVADTQFSVDRGFFDAPFTLEITSATPDAQIYYSLDGSEPSASRGLLYTEPLTITNTTIVRARAFKPDLKPTDIDTETYIFLDDVIHQAPTGAAPPNFPASWGRNRVDYGMDPTVVSKYSLAEWHEALTQIPTMSIVTEVENLFDPVTGIYANADGHGEDWERPSSIELIDPHGTPQGQFQENCGLRIRGGYSRNTDFVKHSLRVFFRRDYGAAKLHYPLFENEGADTFDTFDLRTSQNYAWPRETSLSNGQNDTLVREVFCRETLGKMGQPYRRSRYYHLYLNGQYWGIYMTDERPEASYGATYLGGNKDDYDVVKCANHIGNFVTEATDGNFGTWTNLFTMGLDMLDDSGNANYFRMLGRNPDGTRNPALPVMVDADNLINYMLGIFYTGDGDATLSSFLGNTEPNNWFGMKNRNNPDQGFLFFNSDCEHTLGAPSSQVDRTGPWKDIAGSNVRNFTYSNPQYLHEELMLNPEYRLLFADHVQRHFFNGGVLTPEACTNRFLRWADQINQAIRAYEARWGDANNAHVKYSATDWTNRINTIVNSWFPNRTATVLQQLKVDNLYPAISAPEFSQLGGDIAEGFNLTMTNPNASGAIYYTLDGTDPRQVGGTVNPTAAAYSSPIALNASTRVKARVLNGSTWSALVEADFAIPGIVPLRITELMYHPAPVSATEAAAGFSNADDFEFIELRNVGAITINLAGIQFVDGITFTFPSGSLAPGERILVVKNLAAFNLRYGPVSRVAGYYSGNLNNAGEHLRLQDAAGRAILDFSYADGWYPITDGFGFSLVAVDENAPASTWGSKSSWQSGSNLGGSPGAANPPSPGIPFVVINEVLTRPAAGGKVSVELANLSDSPADVGNWWLTDDFRNPWKFRLPANTIIPVGGFVVFNEDDFGPTALGMNAIQLSSAGSEIRLFSADANGDFTGYVQGWDFGPAEADVSFGRYVISTGADHLVAQTAVTLDATNAEPRIGPVVISEIMYRPPDLGMNDNSRDEYLELLNTSPNPVPLFEPAAPVYTWRVTGGVDFALPPDLTLAAGEYLLVVSFNPATDPALLADFRVRYSVPANVCILGPYSGKLDNSGESVELRTAIRLPTSLPAWAIADKVSYEDADPWPGGADGYGPSLQRVDVAAYGNDPVNWVAVGPRPGRTFVGGTLPVITIQPTDQAAVEQTSATFSVEVEDSSAVTYQWRFEGHNIADATNTTYSIEPVQPADEGLYSVVILGAGGAVVSSNAALTVLSLPKIIVHPESQTVDAGGTAMLSVVASGTGSLSYQWRRNGIDVPGATSASLTVTDLQLDVNDGIYTVVVTDAVGSRESHPALVVLLLPPAVVEGPFPTNQVVASGSTFTISLTVRGTLPIGYYWRLGNGYYNFESGGGYTYAETNSAYVSTSVLVITNAQKALHENKYRVGISNSVQTYQTASAYAYVTVIDGPAITLQPTNQSAALGAPVTFHAGASGEAPLTFQWWHNDAPIAGATGTSYSLNSVQASDAGAYTFVASNPAASATSHVAYLTLPVAPTIVTQPADQAVHVCSNAVFTVEASGAPLSYQWWFNATNRLANETNASLVIVQPGLADEGRYSVVVSNLFGATPSDAATLTLLDGDSDGDGMSDTWELAHGLNPCDASDRDLDPDQDGRTNWQEFVSGTDPGSNASVLRVSLVGDSGGARIQFEAAPNVGYTIQVPDQLDGRALAEIDRHRTRSDSAVGGLPGSQRSGRWRTVLSHRHAQAVIGRTSSVRSPGFSRSKHASKSGHPTVRPPVLMNHTTAVD